MFASRPVYHVPLRSKFVFVRPDRGSDASNQNDEEPDEHDEHDSQYIPCSKQGNYWPGKPLPRTEYRSSLKAVEGEKGLFFFFLIRGVVISRY